MVEQQDPARAQESTVAEALGLVTRVLIILTRMLSQVSNIPLIVSDNNPL